VAVAIVTNQSPVGRRMISLVEAQRISAWVVGGIEALGGQVTGVWHCPHIDADGCACRKPRPGMLLAAMRTAGVEAARTWIIGDHDSDVQAGRAAGCGRTIQVTSGRQRTPSSAADAVFPDLAAAVGDLLGRAER
jgi:D-glycero-D-manno-heptose 1,7-bisphosphate phosphatase